MLDGIVLIRVIILSGAVFAIVVMILAGVLTRLIITIIMGRWNHRTVLASILTVIRWRDWSRGRRGSRCWIRYWAVRITSLAVGIDNHAGFTWFTVHRRLDDDDVRLLLVLFLAFAVKLGIAAGTAHENEGQQKAVNQWFTHLKTSLGRE